MTTTYQTERTYPTQQALEDALLPFTRRGLAVHQEDGSYYLNKRRTWIDGVQMKDSDEGLSIYPRHYPPDIHVLELWVTTYLPSGRRSIAVCLCTLGLDSEDGYKLHVSTYPTEES